MQVWNPCFIATCRPSPVSQIAPVNDLQNRTFSLLARDTTAFEAIAYVAVRECALVALINGLSDGVQVVLTHSANNHPVVQYVSKRSCGSREACKVQDLDALPWECDEGDDDDLVVGENFQFGVGQERCVSIEMWRYRARTFLVSLTNVSPTSKKVLSIPIVSQWTTNELQGMKSEGVLMLPFGRLRNFASWAAGNTIRGL